MGLSEGQPFSSGTFVLRVVYYEHICPGGDETALENAGQKQNDNTSRAGHLRGSLPLSVPPC